MESTSTLNESGIALTEANRPHEAISFFRQALSIEPGNPLLWLNLGIAQQRTGEYSEALDSFRHSIQIDHRKSDAWGAMGLIYYELKQFVKAEACYQEALTRESTSPKIWNNLGVLYFTQGSYEEARDCFEEALSLFPRYYDALYNLRDTCRELGDFRAAAECERIISDSYSAGAKTEGARIP